MQTKDPFRTLSRKTAEAAPNSPEIEAFRTGMLFVPNTWGGYATKAVDLELCEPNPDAVIELFGGREVVDLDSAKIVFDTNGEFLRYKSRWIDQRTKWHTTDLLVERNRLCEAARLIMSQWEVDQETAQLRAKALQLQINDSDIDVDVAVLCLKRDGLNDGIEVTLGEFAEAMLTANILDDEFPSELATSWIGGIGNVIDDLQRDYGYMPDFEDRRIADLPISMEQIGGFLGNISSSHTYASYPLGQTDWEHVYPVFAPPKNLSILEGNEI